MRLIILLFSILFTMSCSQNNFNDYINKSYKTAHYELKGNVKSLMETNIYDISHRSDSVLAGDTIQYTYEFNNVGMLLKKLENMGRSNEMISTSMYKDDKLVEIITYRGNQHIVAKKFIYSGSKLSEILNIRNQDTSTIFVNRKRRQLNLLTQIDETKQMESILSFDRKQNVIKEIYLRNGVKEQMNVYTFKPGFKVKMAFNGNQEAMYIEKTEYYPQSEIPKTTETKILSDPLLKPKMAWYDSVGNIIKQEVYRNDSSLMFSLEWEYTYDEHQNWTLQKNYNNGKLYSVFYRDIVYY